MKSKTTKVIIFIAIVLVWLIFGRYCFADIYGPTDGYYPIPDTANSANHDGCSIVAHIQYYEAVIDGRVYRLQLVPANPNICTGSAYLSWQDCITVEGRIYCNDDMVDLYYEVDPENRIFTLIDQYGYRNRCFIFGESGNLQVIDEQAPILMPETRGR